MWLDPKQIGRLVRTVESGEAGVPGEPDERTTHPERIGRYRILAHLGRGGMATVYEAQQEETGQHVALKVPALDFISPSMMRRFRHEVRLLGRLEHPGIARIYEASTFDSGDGARPFFAMELVRGRPITTFACEERLDLEPQLALMASVCDAVQYAHAKGIVHRDLKPGNVLVVREEERQPGQPKILDFGVARATDSDMQATTMHTDCAAVVGTLPYMSPEQVAGDPDDVDARSDVYSLGVVLYQLLTGQTPFDLHDRSIPEAARIIRDEQPARPGALDRNLRGDVETIVTTAMAKDRSRRYQSAADLAADLRRYLRHEPIAARPPSVSYQLARFTRRHRALVIGVAAVFVLLVAALAIVSRSRLQAVRAERHVQETADLLFQIVEDMSSVIGTQQISRTALEGLYQQYSALEHGTAAEDPMLRAKLAEVMENLGVADVNNADIDGGERWILRALEIRQDLVRLHPEEPAFRDALSINMVTMGHVANNRSRFDEELGWYRRALEIDEDLVAEYPDNLHYRDNLTWSYERVATCYGARGRIDLAEPLCLKRHELCVSLVEAEPDNLTRVRGLLDSRLQLADIALAKADLMGAEAHMRASEPLVHRLLAEEPNEREHQRVAARCAYLRGEIAEYRGDYATAELHARERVAVWRGLAQQEPADAAHRLYLARSLVTLARWLHRAGQTERAETAVREAIDLLTALVESNPSSPDYRTMLSDAFYLAGKVCRDAGRLEEAQEYVGLAAEQIRAFLEIGGDTLPGLATVAELVKDSAPSEIPTLLERAQALRQGASPRDLINLAHIYRLAGDEEAALAVIAQVEAASDPADGGMRRAIDSFRAIGSAPAREPD